MTLLSVALMTAPYVALTALLCTREGCGGSSASEWVWLTCQRHHCICGFDSSDSTAVCGFDDNTVYSFDGSVLCGFDGVDGAAVCGLTIILCVALIALLFVAPIALLFVV
jgi:hypothetical protein